MRLYLLNVLWVCISVALAADNTTPPTPDSDAGGKSETTSMTSIGGKGLAGPGIINRDPAKAISEIGELYYPGAKVLNSLVCYLGGPEDVMVLMSTTDPLDKVKDYYNPKFTGSEVTHTEGPRYYSLLRPERSINKVGMPPAYVTMLQDYAGKEVIITVFQGYCAYEHFHRTIGQPFTPLKEEGRQQGGFGWDND